MSDDVDANTLQNKLDSLTFQVRCVESEKKNLQEKVNELTAHNIGIKEEFKALEKKFKTNRDECGLMKNQMKILEGENQRAKLARKKAAELEQKLQLYETVELALKGTLPQMMDRLHSLNDYSDNARQLCEVSEVLKKELQNKGLEVKQLYKSLQQKTNELNQMKAQKDENVVKVNQLAIDNNRLRADMTHMEEENNDLRSKLNKLQEALVSPSNDPKSSAIARLVRENPAPLYLEQSPPTPKLAKKSCGIVGLNQRSPCKNIGNSLKRSLSTRDESSDVPTSLFSKKLKSSSLSQPTTSAKKDYFYDGLGGHSKADIFPTSQAKPSSSFVLSKKPKGVSKQPKVNPNQSRKMDTINKYFNFDTP